MGSEHVTDHENFMETELNISVEVRHLCCSPVSEKSIYN